MPEKELRNLEIEDLEIRTDGPVTIRGYAAVFDKLSKPLYGGFREQIAPGAFKWSIEHKNIFALWNHDDNQPIGSTRGGQMKLDEDSKGLHFELTPIDTTAGRDVAEMIRSGVVGGVSFGFIAKEDKWDMSDPKNPIRKLIDVDLLEISPTAFPAYPQTEVAVRSEKDVWEAHVAEQERSASDKKDSEDFQAKMAVVLAQIETLKQLQEGIT